MSAEEQDLENLMFSHQARLSQQRAEILYPLQELGLSIKAITEASATLSISEMTLYDHGEYQTYHEPESRYYKSEIAFLKGTLNGHKIKIQCKKERLLNAVEKDWGLYDEDYEPAVLVDSTTIYNRKDQARLAKMLYLVHKAHLLDKNIDADEIAKWNEFERRKQREDQKLRSIVEDVFK